MGRSPCRDTDGLKKGQWTPQEDQKLLAYIQKHGHGNWSFLPQKAGLQRCGKSCRLRWINYLRPDIKRGKFTIQEDRTIIQLHALLGNRWSAIAAHLPKRTDNEIKNYWNTHLKKRLAMMGIDPVTHKPKQTTLASPSGDPKTASILSHMAQWESARLQAEGRLGRDSKLLNNINNIMPLNNMTSSILSSSSSATQIPLGYHFNGFLEGNAASCGGGSGGGGGDINEVVFANESSLDIATGWINMEARSDMNGEGFSTCTTTSNLVFNNLGMQGLPTTPTTTSTTAAGGGGMDAIISSDQSINGVDLYEVVMMNKNYWSDIYA